MSTLTNHKEQNQICLSIRRTIAYFDIFKYPLRLEEIYKYSDLENVCLEVFTANLINLVKSDNVFVHKGYYGLENSDSGFESRNEAAKGAKNIWPKAIKNGSLIYSLPFVKCVFVSGGLSKEVFRKGDDIDYFIITKHNRVWITKLILKLYKKVFLKNSKDYFCTNYIIGEHNLQIEEQNLFTAIELITLQPLGNDEYYKELHKANTWTLKYLPNADWKPKIESNSSKLWISKIIETLLSGHVGDWLDKRLMKVIFESVKSNYKDKIQHAEFDLMFKTKRNISKIHPTNNQSVIMERYNKKILEMDIQE